MNIFLFISVQVLHKRIRGGGRVKVAADMLTREGSQNFGKSAYVILEWSLSQLNGNTIILLRLEYQVLNSHGVAFV